VGHCQNKRILIQTNVHVLRC